MFISTEQRNELDSIRKRLATLHQELTFEHSEYVLIQTALHSIEDALEKERVKSQ